MSKAEKTKAYIIEKIAPVINKKGYAGTSISDMMEATGLSKGALYGNFSNKDEIALAAYDYNIRQIRMQLISQDKDKTPLQRLMYIPEFYKQQYLHIAAFGGCPILNTAVEADDNHAALKRKVSGTITSWRRGLETTIREGIALGEIKPGLNPEKYACTFLALFEGGIMLSKVTGDITYIYEALDRLSALIQLEMKA